MADAEGSQVEPIVEGIKLKGSLTGAFEEAARRLASIQMYSIKATPTELTLVRVESRNIQKKPFLFMIFRLTGSFAEINYSIGADTSAKTRRLSVLKNFVAVLSLISDLYHVDDSELYQHMDSVIDDVLNSLQASYAQLMSSYESLYNRYIQIKKLNINLSNSNKNLSTQATMLSSENIDIKSRLTVLESYSDESLMAFVEEWLDTHDGTIDVNEFAESHRITSSRTEQILNKMVSLGYIELRG
jgi:hypothetical protein